MVVKVFLVVSILAFSEFAVRWLLKCSGWL